MTADREALDALLDLVFPRVEPAEQRSYYRIGDDAGVDARDDQRRAVDEFIDALVDSPDLEVLVVPTPPTKDVEDLNRVLEQIDPALKKRPWGTSFGLRNAQNAPWERPLNDAELRAKNLDPAEYEPETAGRWAW